MDQIGRLFAALSPAAVGLVVEQVGRYRQEVESTNLVVDRDRGQELAWCDEVLDVADSMQA